jgi:septum formation topological specificity factor MinE
MIFRRRKKRFYLIEKLAARATSTTIVRDILAVIFLMDKSQGQCRIRTIKMKESLLKVLLNLVKSSMLNFYNIFLY